MTRHSFALWHRTKQEAIFALWPFVRRPIQSRNLWVVNKNRDQDLYAIGDLYMKIFQEKNLEEPLEAAFDMANIAHGVDNLNVHGSTEHDGDEVEFQEIDK
jgi:hypothetical protein